MPHLANRLDPIDVTAGWLSASQESKSIHLLANPFLFSPDALVTYFRALNFSMMSRAFETALVTVRQAFNLAVLDPDDGNQSAVGRLRTAVATYLVLEVRRDHVLSDAFDQLWRREKRELLRPFKVRMGVHEGEEGIDHGGVQQEFFRLAISEALNPDFGAYTQTSFGQLAVVLLTMHRYVHDRLGNTDVLVSTSVGRAALSVRACGNFSRPRHL